MVLQALCKSGKEEVLQHSVGTIYNLMTIEESRKIMVKEGVIKIIFELAALGWMSVRHVCSSCLHMAPEAIPDMRYIHTTHMYPYHQTHTHTRLPSHHHIISPPLQPSAPSPLTHSLM